jgi:hypothetical protein
MHRYLSALATILALSLHLGCATRSSSSVAASAPPGHAAANYAADEQAAPEHMPHQGAPYHGSARGNSWPGARAHAPERKAHESDAFESPGAARERPTSAPERRPGLATRWGERRDAAVRETTFIREQPTRPFAVLALHYDDEEGVAWKTGRDVERALPGVHSVRGGAIEVSVVASGERPLPQVQAGGVSYVIGDAGTRYALRLVNHTRDRYEVVASVDGLDVITGTPADYHHRGYVLAPWSTLLIEGFRESAESVRAFRFGDVEEAYAIARGHGRDIGVIGVALFSEELGGRRAYTDGPRPFPGEFAPPPNR